MELIELQINYKRRAVAPLRSPREIMKNQNDKVPLFKLWTHWYVFVIVFLIVQIILFYVFTKNFS